MAHRTARKGYLDLESRLNLQHLIIDNSFLASHRVMAAAIGAILRLPPVKRTMAAGQLGSRYLEKLIGRNTQ